MLREVSGPGLREFGDAGDLELDLHNADRPTLVTSLLSRCGGAHDEAYWWRQPAGQRIAALLTVVARTEPGRDMSFTAVCGLETCGQEFEFAVSLDELLDSTLAATPPASASRVVDGRTMTIRPATGADLRNLRASSPADRDGAVRMLLDALVVEGQVNVSNERIIGDIAAELDPLVDFAAACACPACGEPVEVPIDLEAHAIHRLAIRQREILEDVHVLASRYGWTEPTVLSLPRRRRRQYRSLIERLG